MEGHAWGRGQVPQVFVQLRPAKSGQVDTTRTGWRIHSAVHVVSRVLVFSVAGSDVEVEVRSIVLVVFVVRNVWSSSADAAAAVAWARTVGKVVSESNTGFVGPAPGHVADRVASASKQQQRDAILLHVCHREAVT